MLAQLHRNCSSLQFLRTLKLRLCLKSLNYYMLRNTIFYLLVLNFFTAEVFLHVSDVSAAVILVPGLSAGFN